VNFFFAAGLLSLAALRRGCNAVAIFEKEEHCATVLGKLSHIAG